MRRIRRGGGEGTAERRARLINKQKIYILSGLRKIWFAGRRVGEESTVEAEDWEHIKE
jgi:hypothetical protein